MQAKYTIKCTLPFGEHTALYLTLQAENYGSCPHPAVADHSSLSGTEFQDIPTKQLLAADKIHFQRVELFLKGIFIHALEQSNKTSGKMNGLFYWLTHF